jgi:hypothetical protein
MRAHCILLNAPSFHNPLGLCYRIEPPGIQHFLTNATVKPINKGILIWVSRLDNAQRNPVPFGSADELRRDHLRAVVKPDRLGLAMIHR